MVGTRSRANVGGGDDAAETARQRYRASLGRLDASYHELQAALLDGAAALIAIRSHLDRGGTAAQFLDTVQPRPLRANIASALTDFERARHESNRLLWRLLLAEGKTRTEIGRIFGVSRQLVSRLLGETD